ncbi:hypothetical protein CAEBREN_29495 [Caenorhabditis brenneri]|uniref:Protein SON n=1 Tax=Caenorhabditis brenneri TaxID=135651 RepID=G0PK40_CAEBE|nr:hypothetical protein CAEBREN_29495 [Caenorhabditis brenneri]
MSDDVGTVPVSSSEAIIAELLNDIKSCEQVSCMSRLTNFSIVFQSFTVDKLAGCGQADIVEDKHKKHKHRSSHRSKKSKKERKRSRTWSDSSRSRSRSRNRSRTRNRSNEKSKSKKQKSSRSRSRSRRKESKRYHKEIESDTKSTLSDKKSIEMEEPCASNSSVPENSRLDETNVDAKNSAPEVTENSKTETSETINSPPKIGVVCENKSKDFEDGEIEDFVYGLTDELPISSSLKENEKKNSKADDSEKDVVNDTDKKKKKKSKEKKRRRSTSSSRDKNRRERYKWLRDLKCSNSRFRNSNRSRSRSKERRTRRHSPAPIRLKRDERPRRRSLSRDRRARSYDRSSRWRSRSRERREYEAYRRKRSRSREVIDKEKLLAIAKTKRAEMMSNGDRDNASIEDFVTYCKKLQKRQEREKQREAGQAVSDHDSDGEVVRYKHPYAMPKDPIRINIVTATSASLAQKAIMGSEEPAQLGASELRIVYPVSSGAVHKENAEWIPVEKEEVPKSCSVEQKKLVALTSLEIDRCRAQGIPVAPVPVPKFLNSILPPPPKPPQFLPNPVDRKLDFSIFIQNNSLQLSDHQLHHPFHQFWNLVIFLFLLQKLKEKFYLHQTISTLIVHCGKQMNSFQIKLWAALKSLPGEYTGSTGLRLLTADELQPHNPKFHAWVKKDQFRNAAPANTGLGRQLLEKMGWRPGEGLGKDATGNVEPLVLDVKSDRKGLMAEEEMTTKQRNKANTQNNVPVDLSTKNPISLIMELCAKRRWDPPAFTCEDSGADHMKLFIWTVVINGVEYRPMCGSKQKKEGKAVAAQVALQSLGILPRDPDLPVYM